jgi:hypothetical protein
MKEKEDQGIVNFLQSDNVPSLKSEHHREQPIKSKRES